MIRNIILAAVLLTAPALADGDTDCNPPKPMEVTVDGATASEAQMKDAIAQFKAFDKAVADFNQCVDDKLKAMDAAAKNASSPKPVDPAMVSSLKAQSSDITAADERAAGQLNAQIRAYQAVHPKKS